MVANFSVAAAITLLSEIDVLVSVSSHNKEHAARKEHERRSGREFAADDAKEEQARLEAVKDINLMMKHTDNMLQFFKSPHIESAATRLKYWANESDRRWEDLFTRSCALRDAIRVEFKEYLFYAYPREKGQKLTDWAEDWKKVSRAFPDTRIETYSATDCFALGLDIASVFHSMRAAEHGLRALASERRVKLPRNKPVEWATWQEIIKALDDEIKAIGIAKKAGKAKDAALAFYSGARADLNGFKDEYRNAVMHVRVSYDEHQAARALSQVHAFMERLAGKLDHTHKRINWGRS